MSRRIRVLVVDDSAFARKVVRDVIATAPDLEVIDWARDGLEALEKIGTLRPDVVTLDLMMPNLDGVGVLRALPAGAPPVLVVSLSDGESELGLQALEAGAVDLVHKPTALPTGRLYDMGAELLEKLRAVAGSRPPPPLDPVPRPVTIPPAVAVRSRLLVIGASTGGPQALTRIIRSLPSGLPVPVVIGLHIPAGYTESLARRLDGISALRVQEATDGSVLEAGSVHFAPGGAHLRIDDVAGRFVTRIVSRPEGASYAPSIDRLFESAAASAGAAVLGVVLTGMGDDGLAGAAAVKAAGGRILAEAEATCVVYGMPRCVIEAGLADEVARVDEMVAAILRHL